MPEGHGTRPALGADFSARGRASPRCWATRACCSPISAAPRSWRACSIRGRSRPARSVRFRIDGSRVHVFDNRNAGFAAPVDAGRRNDRTERERRMSLLKTIGCRRPRRRADVGAAVAADLQPLFRQDAVERRHDRPRRRRPARPRAPPSSCRRSRRPTSTRRSCRPRSPATTLRRSSPGGTASSSTTSSPRASPPTSPRTGTQAIADGDFSADQQDLVSVDGKPYGVLLNVANWVMFYNTEAFEKAGIAARRPPGPSSWTTATS